MKGAGSRMALTDEDKKWLDAFRRDLEKQFPNLVERILLFGSKARGDARDDSDLDLLLVIRQGNWRAKDAVACVAYDLAIGTSVVPSLQIYTAAEWERMRERESVFRELVEREGIALQ